MKYVFPFLLILWLFTGCMQPQPPLRTVDNVELDRYLGTWYEIARYEHFFERGCSDVSANYSLDEDGDLKVVNRCIKDGEPTEAKGTAYSSNRNNTKLKVSFFWPFYGDYWVLILDDDYQYAVVGEPSREYLWILSRTPRLDEDIREAILKQLPELGYTTDKLIWTKQTEH